MWCVLHFKNSAEKEKTIFRNIFAVISRKYKKKTSIELVLRKLASQRNMAGGVLAS